MRDSLGERSSVASAEIARKTIARAAAFLRRGMDREGRSICSAHGLEHAGNTAYLLRVPGALDGASSRALAERLTAMLRPHPKEPEAWVFGPGPTVAKNLANWVVDSASIAAGLAAAIERGEGSAVVRDALARCAQTYLLPCAKTKRVVAQRAWALWGAALAARALEDEALAAEARSAVEAVLRSVRDDGGTLYDESDEPRGTGSASLFYHSRVLGFTRLAACALGAPELVPRAILAQAARWLDAALFPDGAKAARPEAKPWYFPEGLEDVSAPFDLLLLVPAAIAEASAAWARAVRARLLRHAFCFDREHEVLASVHGGEAFPCETFAAAHALLLGEISEEDWTAIDRLAGAEVIPATGWELLGVSGGTCASKLARWRSPDTEELWLLERGAAGLLHGSEAGGIRAGHWRDERGTHFEVPARSDPPGFRWRERSASVSAWFRALRPELRFALHLLRTPSGTKGWGGALRARLARFVELLRAARFEASGWIAASNAALVEAAPSGRRLELVWRPRRWDGTELAGVRVCRTIAPTARGTAIRERLELEHGIELRDLRFAPPPGAARLRGDLRAHRLRGRARLVVRYTLPS